MKYNQLVETFFFNPEHVGILESLPWTIKVSRGSVSSGNYFDLYLRINPRGMIEKATFKAFGVPYLIAGLEWICRQAKGCFINQALLWNYQTLIQVLDLPHSQYPLALLMEKGYVDALLILQTSYFGDKS